MNSLCRGRGGSPSTQCAPRPVNLRLPRGCRRWLWEGSERRRPTRYRRLVERTPNPANNSTAPHGREDHNYQRLPRLVAITPHSPRSRTTNWTRGFHDLPLSVSLRSLSRQDYKNGRSHFTSPATALGL